MKYCCIVAGLEHVDALNERYTVIILLHQYSPSTVAYVLLSVQLLLVFDSKPLMALVGPLYPPLLDIKAEGL